MLKKVRLQPALANSFGTLALVTLLLLALSPKLFAAGEECMHRLASGQAGKPVVSSKAEPEVIPSGRDSDLFQTFQKNVKEILGPNGIAARLGLAVPPHQVEFVPAGELSLLATLGRHAIGHWVDGSQLAQKVYENTGVLEFVTPGCPTCRSFYSDTTSYEHQLSILFHVAGHNDFSVNSTMFRKRNADPIMESLKFYDKVENYYALYGHDEVSRWYQYLESLMYMQDLSRGSFDHPSTFVRPSDAENTPATRMPASPTKSILQAMIENLPAGTPSWKKEMLISFEAMNRVYGAYATTKIMNEGWATLM